MDKGERNRIKQLKFKKRLADLYRGNDWDDALDNNHCYKTTGKPCSCEMCSPSGTKKKYKIKHKGKFNLNEDDVY